MAALPRPQEPCTCGSASFKKFRDPERWVCTNCDVVVASRPSRKLASGVCRHCGKPPTPDMPFKPGKNLHKKCAGELLAKWKADNAEHCRAQRQRPEEKARRFAAVRRSIQKSPEAFIAYIAGRLKRPSVIRRRHNPAITIVELDSAHFIRLYRRQRGLCAISGIPMTHTFNNLLSISIDRKNSDKGYVKGNVQLVCQWVNHAKRHHSNALILSVLDQYYQLRCELEGRG